MINISKAMSYVLRHGAENLGIAIRPDGFIYLDDLLAVKSVAKLKPTYAMIEHIVNNNDKKRFELSEEQGVKLIRAV